MTPEGRIENYLKFCVKKAGGKFRKLKWLGRNGAPDRMIWWEGPRMAFIEVKRPGEGPTRAQRREHDRLRVDGFHVFTVNDCASVEQVVHVVSSLWPCSYELPR
jgi:hypothetical protein